MIPTTSFSIEQTVVKTEIYTLTVPRQPNVASTSAFCIRQSNYCTDVIRHMQMARPRSLVRGENLSAASYLFNAVKSILFLTFLSCFVIIEGGVSNGLEIIISSS